MSDQAVHGSTVTLHYTGTLEDGRVFGATTESDPLVLIIGGGEYLRAFEEALVGMAPGEKKSFTIDPEKAYGQWQEGLVAEVPRTVFGPGPAPEPGSSFLAELTEGEKVPVRVAAVTEETVVIDANHPLAGEILCFEVEVVSVS
ncbi:peptidylprolyl isomerase [Methanofollis formosanus]|uniref:Peptidyl-prolyl cis-trans isomerase n=1 Tax=Methanofollis formosanus TaxID=299308 RepID=A0A8G1EGR3_9EURY|nr:peptidylprolyl isomerase [Methanofollis formosanus]QYZ79454.1 peptidylprolyl isomerase [Methanofollis formosanus]